MDGLSEPRLAECRKTARVWMCHDRVSSQRRLTPATCDNAEVWTQVKGAYGQGEGGDMFGYQGQAGMHVTW